VRAAGTGRGRPAAAGRVSRGVTVLVAWWAAVVSAGALPAVAAGCVRPAPDSFTGRVVAVLDGDSLRILRDGAQVEVRLLGIDAPEGGQAFGNVSKRALSNLAFGRMVVVEVREIDRYGRSVARVTADGTDIGLEMVRGGFAWHYARYLDDARYGAAQREARAARRGLWQDPAPVAPWDFRPQRAPARRSPAEAPRSSVPGDPCYTDARSALSPAADGTPCGLPLPSTSKLRAV